MTSSAYSAEEVLDNFEALLRDVVFPRELRLLGVGRFHFLRRRQMLLELRALYIGLWHLALQRSFPTAHQELFDAFLARYARRRPDRESARLLERAVEYVEMLRHKGDRDFTEVSRHLASFLELDEDASKTLALRLALALRASYTFIFERLI